MSHTKIKGIIFISNVQKALEHEWFCEYTDKEKFDFEFILFNSYNSELYNFIKNQGFKCENYRLKSKFIIPLYILFFSIKMMLKRYDFIHCHLFEASLIGLVSAKLTKIKKRIYTRHHADFHHKYFPNAVKYDLLINRCSTHIIAISNNIKCILMKMESVPEDKITLIHHGIPLKLINKTVSVNDINAVKQKYNIDGFYPIIGVVSRFTEWKGVQYVIPAFEKILKTFPKAKLVLANAQGDYFAQLSVLLSKIPSNNYILIPFENDMSSLFKSFDIFVHVPIDPYCEAFGQVYIESLSLNVPLICTLSGIANDFIVNEQNSIVVDYKNSEEIYKAIINLLNDEDLMLKITKNGNASVQKFSFEHKYEKLIKVYLS